MERGKAETDIHAPCLERIARLEARIRELEHRLGKNSSNSSKPPSTDLPEAPPPAKPPEPSGRKPGGQPGHPPARRTTFPEDQVDHFVRLFPKKCGNCGRRFSSQPPPKTPVWESHQFVEVPAIWAEVTEVQAHALECTGCGAWTPAEIPEELSGSIAGPRLQALASLLSGRFRLSRREVEDALTAMFGPKADLALGTISNLEEQSAEALAPVYEEAHQAAQAAPQANFDETGWPQGRKPAWLWVMVTSLLTVFRIDRRRNSDAFKALAGNFKGILTTDRWRTYMSWIKRLHQFCWAHLKRDFKSWKDLGRKEGRIGAACLSVRRRSSCCGIASRAARSPGGRFRSTFGLSRSGSGSSCGRGGDTL